MLYPVLFIMASSAILTCFGLGYALVSGQLWLLIPGILFGFCLIVATDKGVTQ